MLRYAPMERVRRLTMCAALATACGGQPQKIVDVRESTAIKELHGALVFFPGESFEWKFSIARVEGGQITMAVGAPGQIDNRNVVIVASRVEQSGLASLLVDKDADLTTWIDVAAGVPIRHRAVLSSNTTSETIEAEFSRGKISMVRVGGTEGESTPSRSVSPDNWPHNTSSLMLALRNWTAPKGSEASFEFLAHSRVWRVNLKMGDIEEVTSPAGTFRARRIDGVGVRLTTVGKLQPETKKEFTFFYTADDLRLPVSATSETRVGRARLELVGYRNGAIELPAGDS